MMEINDRQHLQFKGEIPQVKTTRLPFEFKLQVTDKFTPAIEKIIYEYNTEDVDYTDVTNEPKLLGDGK